MSEQSVVVTEAGFAPAGAAEGFIAASDLPVAVGRDLRVDLGPDGRPEDLAPYLDRIGMIRIAFPGFADGRGFTLARELRRRGFTGRLRAAGHILSDQFRLARSCGFDDVEIPAELARRQPEDLWKAPARLGYLDLLR